MVLPHFPGPLTLADWLGWPVAAGHRAVRVRRAAVSHRASALPPLAAGGLGRRGRPGRVGPGQRVRSHDHHGQPVEAEPGRRDRAGRDIFKLMVVVGAGLIAATGLAAVAVPGVPVPARRAPPNAPSSKWLVYAGVLVVAAILIGRGPSSDHGPGQRGHQPAERDRQRRRRARPGGHRRRRPALPAVRHRPDHLPDPGLRDRHRPADRDLCRAGPAGHRGAPDPRRGSGSRRHPDRGGAVQPGAAAGAAPGRPAVQPGPVRRGRPPLPRSPPGSRTRSTWTASAPTWPAWCRPSWNPPRSGSGPGTVSPPRRPAPRPGSRPQVPPTGACRRCAHRRRRTWAWR